MSNPNRIIRSLKKGDDSDERKIIDNATAVTAVNGVPAATENGFHLQHAEVLHIYPRVTGATPNYTLKLHYFSNINGLWHPASGTISITDGTIQQVAVNGEDRVYFEITAEDDAADTLELWAGYNTPSAS